MRKLLMLLLFFTTPCFATANISLMLGGALPAGNTEISGNRDASGDGGGVVGAQLMIPINEQLSVGVDLLANDLGERTSTKLLGTAPATADYQTKTLAFLFGGRLQSKALIADRIQPYLFGGIGFHRTSSWGDITPNPGFIWTDTSTAEKRRAIDDTATGFAAAAAIGVDVPLSSVISFGLEGRFEYLSQVKYETRSISAIEPTATEVKVDPSSANLLARLSFHF